VNNKLESKWKDALRV